MGVKDEVPLAPVALDKTEAEKMRRIDKIAGEVISDLYSPHEFKAWASPSQRSAFA